MKRRMQLAALALLTLASATACPRRVEVESEPNRPDYRESATVAAAEPATHRQ